MTRLATNPSAPTLRPFPPPAPRVPKRCRHHRVVPSSPPLPVKPPPALRAYSQKISTMTSNFVAKWASTTDSVAEGKWGRSGWLHQGGAAARTREAMTPTFTDAAPRGSRPGPRDLRRRDGRPGRELDPGSRRCSNKPRAPCPWGSPPPSRLPTPIPSTCAPARVPRSGTSTDSELLRLPQRLWGHGRGPRPSQVVAAIERAARTGTHFAVTTETDGGAGRGALPAIPARTGPVHQLGHRGDHGCHPSGPRRHGPRRHLQDRGLLPRPPRHGHVLRRPGRDLDRGRRRPPSTDAGVEGHPDRYGEVDPGSPLQRPRHRRGLFAQRAERDRLPHHRAGDDEHRHRPPPPGLSGGIPRARARATASSSSSTRSSAAPPSPPAAPSSASASSPTWSAWPSRSAAGYRRGAFGGQAELMDSIGERRRPAGHLQRQPTGRRGRAGSPHRGPHPGRLCALRPHRHPAGGGMPKAIADHGIPAHVVDLGCKGCVSYRAAPAEQLPRLPRNRYRSVRRLMGVDAQPRDLHDARQRGTVDVVGPARRRAHRPFRGGVRRSAPRSA